MPMKPCPEDVIVSRRSGRDVVPMRELVGDDLRRLGIVRLQILDRLIGKDDAPAERHARRVTLEHRNLVRRIARFIEMAK